MTTLRSVPNPYAESKPQSSIVVASMWMVLISLLLFFLPVINGFIGGAVGGYKVGSVGRALIAAVLPAIVVALGLWGIFLVYEAPVWGVLAGTTAGMLVAISDLGIFVGAAFGGALSRRTMAP